MLTTKILVLKNTYQDAIALASTNVACSLEKNENAQKLTQEIKENKQNISALASKVEEL